MSDRSFFDPGFSHTRNTTKAASRQSCSKALLDFRAWLDDYRQTCQRQSETHDDAMTRRHWSGAVEALTWVHKRFSEV